MRKPQFPSEQVGCHPHCQERAGVHRIPPERCPSSWWNQHEAILVTADRLRASNSRPLVTVLLPVRNAEAWIDDTISSLKTQSLTDFEVLVVDDKGEDRSIEILRRSGLRNLRIIQGRGQGLAQALALGVLESRASIIARQDADDLSFPERLAVQYEFLSINPDYVACGSAAIEIDEFGRRIGRIEVPLSNAAIRLRMTFLNPFVHSSIMMRKDAVLAVGNYRSPSSSAFPEDFDLWARLSSCGKMMNFPDSLVAYRRTPDGLTSRKQREIGRGAGLVAVANVERALGRPLTDREMTVITTFHWRDRALRPTDAALLLWLMLHVRRRYPLRAAGAWGSPVWLQPIKSVLPPRHRGQP